MKPDTIKITPHLLILLISAALLITAHPLSASGAAPTMSITILAPKPTGLTEAQNYLPALVQGEFVSNFSGYSSISVLDRVRLDDIYLELYSDIYDDSTRAKQDLGRLTPTSHIMHGGITKTATGYALHIHITGTADKMTVASYSGTFTSAELDDLTGIRRASLELLQKLGVSLTAKTQEELAGAATSNHVVAQTALARGVTAQRQGAEVEALGHYFHAAAFEPSLAEALDRSSALAASVSGRDTGQDARDDASRRQYWIERLTEIEQIYDNFSRMGSTPYTLFHSEIRRGVSNYWNEPVAVSIDTYLYGSDIWTPSIERVLRTLYDGLNATGMKKSWELDKWPQHGVTDPNAFAKRSRKFTIVLELLNGSGEVLGRQALQTGVSWELDWGDHPRVNISAIDEQTVTFPNILINTAEDLAIRVASVNGVAAEAAAQDRILQTRTISKEEFDTNTKFRFARGEVQGFVSKPSKRDKPLELIIPDAIWGDPVISIGRIAFLGRNLTAVTIPNSVISIGDAAFRGNSLTDVVIPNSVVSIGNSAFMDNKLVSVALPSSIIFIDNAAFRDNRLTAIVIPDGITVISERAFMNNRLSSIVIPAGVTYIGENAFTSNHNPRRDINASIPKISVTIGANVSMAENPFEVKVVKDFRHYYERNGKRAGTYNFPGNGRRLMWAYSP